MLLLLSPWKLDLLHPSQVWWGFSQWPDWRLPWLQQVSEPTGRKKSHKTAQNHFCLCSPPPSTPHVSPHPHSHPPTPSHSHQYKRDYITTATVWASWDKDTVYIYFLLFTDWYRRLCCSNTAVSKGGEFLVVLHTKCGCGALWGRKGGNTVSHRATTRWQKHRSRSLLYLSDSRLQDSKNTQQWSARLLTQLRTFHKHFITVKIIRRWNTFQHFESINLFLTGIKSILWIEASQ